MHLPEIGFLKILMVHQNMPGQYREMVQWLAQNGSHDIVFLTQRKEPPKIPGVKNVVYAAHHTAREDAYGLSKTWEDAVGYGFGAAMAARELERKEGFKPDIILGHTGWGELLFFKQVWKDVPILGFFEYFYLNEGGPVGFDPEDPPTEHTPFLLHARNAVPFANIEVCDRGVVPTHWQHSTFPQSFQDRLTVCHDGIRTDQLVRAKKVSIGLGRMNKMLTREDEVFTYIARNMERTRGFHTFMRALPTIQKKRPNARALIIGGNETSYGKKSGHPGGLRGEMEEEVGASLDWDRIHFVGRVPYPNFCDTINLSRCHIYLTMPFVLSWSLLEAMSMEATIVTSDVAPVREAVTHGETGLLVDFLDPSALADQVVDVLTNPGAYAHLGPAARASVVENYDFLTKCLPEHIRLINDMIPAKKRIRL